MWVLKHWLNGFTHCIQRQAFDSKHRVRRCHRWKIILIEDMASCGHTVMLPKHTAITYVVRIKKNRLSAMYTAKDNNGAGFTLRRQPNILRQNVLHWSMENFPICYLQLVRQNVDYWSMRTRPFDRAITIPAWFPPFSPAAGNVKLYLSSAKSLISFKITSRQGEAKWIIDQ